MSALEQLDASSVIADERREAAIVSSMSSVNWQQCCTGWLLVTVRYLMKTIASADDLEWRSLAHRGQPNSKRLRYGGTSSFTLIRPSWTWSSSKCLVTCSVQGCRRTEYKDDDIIIIARTETYIGIHNLNRTVEQKRLLFSRLYGSARERWVYKAVIVDEIVL